MDYLRSAARIWKQKGNSENKEGMQKESTGNGRTAIKT
jgi:hypothetical protein